jgi:DNA repair protein RecO (recombination protein O)
MGATYHATAIILRREPWRDSARLYTLYTREWGKLLAVGRGTAKSTSKLGAHLEPFTLTEVHLAKGRRLETLCGAVLMRASEPLVADSARHAAVSLFAEAVDHLVKWNERDERLWNLFDAFLIELSDSDDTDGVLARFVWRFMDGLGYRPAYENCASCRTDVTFGGGLFLPAKGVVLCASCRPHESDLFGALPLRSDELRALAESLSEDSMASPTHRVALAAGLAFLEAHLDRPLNSLPIVRATLNLKPERLKVTML